MSSATAGALLLDLGVRGLVGGEDRVGQVRADGIPKPLHQVLGVTGLLLREGHAETELGGVLEQAVVPHRPRPRSFEAQGVVGKLPP